MAGRRAGEQTRNGPAANPPAPRSCPAGTVIPPGAEPSRNIMLGVVTMAGVLPVALFVRSAQLLSAVNSVSMVFLLFFCCIIALLPFAPTVNTGGRAGRHGGQGPWRPAAGAECADCSLPYALSALHPQPCGSLELRPFAWETELHAFALLVERGPSQSLLPSCAGTLVWWRWEGVLVAFPIVSYGFTAHQYLFQIYPASQVCQQFRAGAHLVMCRCVLCVFCCAGC